MILTEETRSSRRELRPNAALAITISHGLVWDRTRASAMRGWRHGKEYH
jgi:hypothetical protein